MTYKNKETKNQYLRTWKQLNPEKAQISREKARLKSKEYNVDYRQKKPWMALLNSAKDRCKKSEVSYELTPIWAENNWTGFCELTGIKFDLTRNGIPGGKALSPSIDRVDPTKGYLPKNCRFILYCLNSFKGQMTDKEMFSIAKSLCSALDLKNV